MNLSGDLANPVVGSKKKMSSTDIDLEIVPSGEANSALTSSQNLEFYANLSRRLENTKKRSSQLTVHADGTVTSAFSSCDQQSGAQQYQIRTFAITSIVNRKYIQLPHQIISVMSEIPRREAVN